MVQLTPHQSEALRFDIHTSLTANAGSGKTFVLSKRFLEIALTTNTGLRNIAAITFTDKAASELYKKIAGQIEDKISETSDKEILKKLERLRRGLVSANISTIHSFCIDILREHPVEAGLDANFTPIDTQLSDELIEISVDEIIKESFHDEDDANIIKELIRIFESKRLFERELISLIKNRKNILLLKEKTYNKDEREIAEFFNNEFLRLVNEIFISRIDQLSQPFDVINDLVLHADAENSIAIEIKSILYRLQNSTDLKEKIKLILYLSDFAFTKGGTVKKRGYLLKIKDQLPEDEIEFVESFISDFSKIEFNDDHSEIENELAKFGKDVIYIFTKTVDRYDSKKRDNGYLDYEDILILTRKILKNPEVQKKLSRKYRYLMVDEYQDTNEVQYEIFLPILDDLKEGNLFVVGDEKQSIYMFRDAELEVFDFTKKQIAKESGESSMLTLPDTFRMTPSVCGFTNYIFEKLFRNPNLLFNEVAHSEIVCARDDEVKGSIEILIPSDEEENEITEAELTAKRIIKLVVQEKEKNIDWGDVAILCRKRKSFDELESIFIKYNIPYLIIGGKGFYQRQTIYDFYNYFSFLLDKNNDTALIGILRAPFFSISDSKIFEISLEDGVSYFDKLKSYSDFDSEIKTIYEKLNSDLSLANNYNITSIFRKILSETEYLSVIASRASSKQELANIEKLLKVTTDFTMKGFRTLYDYVNFLKESIEKTEDEAQAAVAEEANAVKIMTLHQSKGLEFLAVFLYKSNEVSQKNIVRSKSIAVNKHFGLLTKLPLNKNYFDKPQAAPIIGINNFISVKKDDAENKRLLYVGITRAKNYLFISADLEKEFNYKKDSFMGMLQNVLDLNFNDEVFQISTNLKYLISTESGYHNKEELIDIDIPIIRDIEKIHFDDPETQLNKKPELLIEKIKDKPKGEIISATKVSVYKQCPVKYQLTYEIGFSALMNHLKKWNKYEKDEKNNLEFNPQETKYLSAYSEDKENSKGFSDVKGIIIHKILQKEIKLIQLEKFIKQELINELDVTEYSEKIVNELLVDIKKDIEKFYSSKTFIELKEFKKYKNEFEIYAKENDYFLYGIIDKMVIEKNKIKIIDYKTDNIEETEMLDRSLAYFNQLKFYSYIVRRYFKKFDEIELQLIFIKHPEQPFIKVVSKNELSIVEEEIKEMVKTIRENNFDKNLEHCPECFFSIKNNCIKK